jgi:hypothetical protein|nr:MAG TPA: hypothetical protein [Caudoviricetes sp.]
MTKKRFIKLLMGCFRFSRNEAKAYADDIVRWREKANFNNAIWKNAGDFVREIPPTYSGYYAYIQINELAKSLAANNGGNKWNSITKF